MKFVQLKKAVEVLRQYLSAKTRFLTSAPPSSLNQPISEKGKPKWQPQLIAYRLLGEKSSSILPLFRDLDAGLRKSGMRVSFKPYVSLALLTSIIVTLTTIFVIPLILHLTLQIAIFSSLLFGIGGCLFGWALTIIAFYIYPKIRADSMKRSLDDTMAFSTSYLAILASAGVHPERMFRSLSNIPQRLAVIDESRLIVRDVDLFGADIITALESASKRTSSGRFKELLEGFIATIRSGGNLASYLMQRSRQNIKLKRIALRKFSDTLGVLSEFYVTLLIAGPLIFVVMLAVMAMLGGAELGMLNPNLLLMLLTYIGIPVGSVIFIIILDALSPR